MTKAIAAAHELSGLALVESHYDAIFGDIWGVVHNGVTHASRRRARRFAWFRRKGGAVALISRTRRAPREQVAAQTRLFRRAA